MRSERPCRLRPRERIERGPGKGRGPNCEPVPPEASDHAVRSTSPTRRARRDSASSTVRIPPRGAEKFRPLRQQATRAPRRSPPWREGRAATSSAPPPVACVEAVRTEQSLQAFEVPGSGVSARKRSRMREEDIAPIVIVAAAGVRNANASGRAIWEPARPFNRFDRYFRTFRRGAATLNLNAV